MKKKIISIGLCVAMISSILSGCGSTKEAKDQGDNRSKTTISMWMPPLLNDTEKTFGTLLEGFEEENNCEVKFEIIPWDTYEEKWSAALSSGESPDIGYLYAEMYANYITSGMIEELSDYMTKEDYDEYLYLDRGEMMGGLYGVPIVTGVPFVLYYNQDILNDLGEKAPETWEDFERICKKATKDTDGDGKIDQYGYAVGLNSGDMSNLYMLNAYVYSWLWQAGGDIYNDDYKSVRFQDEAGQKAIEFFASLKDYMPQNVLSLAGTDAFSTIFGQGKAAFGVARSRQNQKAQFAETYKDLNWGYVTSLKGEQYGTFGASDCLSIMSSSEHKELAMKLIKYICGSEFMTEYHKLAPGAPLTKSEAYTGEPEMERIVTEDKDKWRGLQVGPCGSEILENYASEIQAVIEGKKEVKQALDDAAKFANDVLDEYWEENDL